MGDGMLRLILVLNALVFLFALIQINKDDLR